MSSLSCQTFRPTAPPEPGLEQLAMCKAGSPKQWASYSNMVQLAGGDDPFELELAARWFGGFLKRCFPEAFNVPKSSKATDTKDSSSE